MSADNMKVDKMKVEKEFIVNEINILKVCTSEDSEVVIPDGVKSIGSTSFAGCTTLTSVVIPKGCEVICSFAFAGCTSLTSVTIPGSVNMIGKDAFLHCPSLKKVTLPKWTYVEEAAFPSSTKIERRELERQDFEINEEGVLTKCYGIVSGALMIPDGVVKIGAESLSNCMATDVTIPDSVEVISDSAFAGCLNLQSVIIGDGVERIFIYAFCGCRKLKKVKFGKKVRIIGEKAFWDCYDLKSVTVDADCDIRKDAFLPTTDVIRKK